MEERLEALLSLWIVRGQTLDHANPAHSLGLLRTRRKRPGRGAAEVRNEGAPLHVTEMQPLGLTSTGSITRSRAQVRFGGGRPSRGAGHQSVWKCVDARAKP